jgi:Flp pilus assembly protein TadB
MTIIYLLGLATASLLIVLWVEFVPSLPSGRAARYLRESDQPADPELPGWRKWLAWLDRPTARWAPGSILRRTKADLYFAQLAGKWQGWDEVQFTSLRVALALGALVFGLLIYDDLVPSTIASLLGWQVPVVLLGGVARRVRRRFQAQLPEFIQLVAAQMAAGVSLEEALRRTAQMDSLAAQWMRHVLQMSQGRVIFTQLQKEAQASNMPDLIGLAVQLEFVRLGTAQQELMAQMANRIAAEYTAGAEQRAERVGAELVIPMVIFYFLPFIAVILALIGWPILATI